MSHHHARQHEVSPRIVRAVAAATVAAALTAAAGTAWAEPDQPGVTDPGTSSPTQPGITPAPPAPTTPAPAPAPVEPQTQYEPSFIPAPTYDAPPVVEGSPQYVAPSYSAPYSAVPPVVHLPQPTRPVNPVLPRPGTVKIGNFRTAQPAWLSDADARNINGQSATVEARTATFYESIGFPKNQAARAAASTATGYVAGAGLTFAATVVPITVVTGVVGTVSGCAIGAGIGSLVPPQGLNVLPGLAIGCGVGAAAGVATGVAASAGLALGVGGPIGAVAGAAIGAGDAQAREGAPLGAPTDEDPKLSRPTPPHPDANQYELHLDNAGLPGNGTVDYVVNKRGDVSGQINAGPVHAPIAISHEQADAPYKAAGALAQTARDSVANAVVDATEAAKKSIPGLTAAFPQYENSKAHR